MTTNREVINVLRLLLLLGVLRFQFVEVAGMSSTEITGTHLPSSIIRMTPNNLNGAKFYQLRRSPIKSQNRMNLTNQFASLTPTIICTNNEIGLQLNQHQNFGNFQIFASHRKNVEECRKRYSMNMDKIFTTSLDGPCGVHRTYKGVPLGSIDYQLRLILSHDENEITENDKIYEIICSRTPKTMQLSTFYTVTDFDLGTLENKKNQPKCKYSLHENALNGPRILSAKVGDVIFHKWKCSSSDYLFKVYDCVVHDQNNRSYTIIDEDGCSLDDEIIPTPEYDSEHGLIYTPSRAFRFASSNHVHFKCMISLCSKSDEKCSKIIPPKCKRTQKKRQLPEDLTIEQRLLKIHELMNGRRRQTKTNPQNSSISLTTSFSADPLIVTEKQGSKEDPRQLKNMIRTFQIWTWILCFLNIILVLITILLTFRLLQNNYKMDIKDKYNSLFRRSPF